MVCFWNKLRTRLSGTDPVFFCLLTALALVFLLIGASGYSYYFLEHYAMIPAAAFLGILLTRKHSRSALLLLTLGLAVCAWFAISQLLQYASGLTVRSPGTFSLVYLMALPFSAASRDGEKQYGLKLAGLAYIGGALVLVCLTGLLALDLLPGFLTPHVYWDGARLRAMWHPNVCGCVFMIALAFCLYFFAISGKKLHKAFWAVLGAGMFYMATLTNSRTAILLSCCLVAGYLALVIWKGRWKRLIPAAAAAVAVLVLAFLLSQSLFSLHTHRLVRQAVAYQSSGEAAANLVVDTQTGNVTLQADASQKSLLEDAGTLNSRTKIWRSAVNAALNHSRVLLHGTDNTPALIEPYMGVAVYSHNSYLEALLTMGIPGLLFALAFGALALWNILRVLFSQASMERKSIALLMVALMGAGMLEAYLFQGSADFLFTDFLFFLCLGYLTQWKKV